MSPRPRRRPQPAPRHWQSSENPSWCTPPWLLDYYRRIAPIAYDPAGCRGSWVGAALASYEEDEADGLTLSWRSVAGDGLVFVNPPYGEELSAHWAGKIALEADAGANILALVPAYPCAAWWEQLYPRAAAVCYHTRPRRLKFYDPATGREAKDSAPMGVASLLFGRRLCRSFVHELRPLGMVEHLLSTRRLWLPSSASAGRPVGGA